MTLVAELDTPTGSAEPRHKKLPNEETLMERYVAARQTAEGLVQDSTFRMMGASLAGKAIILAGETAEQYDTPRPYVDPKPGTRRYRRMIEEQREKGTPVRVSVLRGHAEEVQPWQKSTMYSNVSGSDGHFRDMNQLVTTHTGELQAVSWNPETVAAYTRYVHEALVGQMVFTDSDQRQLQEQLHQEQTAEPVIETPAPAITRRSLREARERAEQERGRRRTIRVQHIATAAGARANYLVNRVLHPLADAA